MIVWIIVFNNIKKIPNNKTKFKIINNNLKIKISKIKIWKINSAF